MRINSLDSLRGVAICGVVLIHSGQQIGNLDGPIGAFASFGFRGVQLFFIVSALTLCIVTRPDAFNARQFYTRRFFRIAPMFYIAIAFYLAARAFGWMDFAPNGIHPLDIASTILFMHGLVPTAINNVVPGGWSIAAEAIFYALFPVVLTYITNIRRAFTLFSASFLLALCLGVLHKTGAPTDAAISDFMSFNFLRNAPAFAMGILVFFLLKPYIKPSESGSGNIGNNNGKIISASIVIFAIAFAAISDKIPGSGLFFIPILGATTYAATRFNSPIFVNKPLSFFGEISFSLYLIHFAVLHYVSYIIPRTSSAILDLGSIYILTMLFSSFFAWLTYRIVEMPMIAVGRHLSSNGNRVITIPQT